MKVLLLKDVARIGLKGDVVEVSNGYARNCLLPQGYGKQANAEDVKRAVAHKEQRDALRKARLEEIVSHLKKVNDKTITIQANAGEGGHLYAGLHKQDILSALAEQLDAVFEEEHLSSFDVIKEVGEHDITLSHDGKTSTVHLRVSAE